MRTTFSNLMFAIKNLIFASLCLARAHIYLEPPASKIGEPAVLVLIQGAQIANNRYSMLSADIQAQAPFPLHVILPSFTLDIAIPNEKYVKRNIQNALQLLPKNLNAPIYISGHSLGADGAMNLANSSSTFKACIIFGASINRRFKNYFPVPILTVNGELDGLHRISRVAESFFNMFDRKSGINPTSVSFTPVVVIKGQNHLQFADGTNPSVVVKNLDLKADISIEDAITKTAEIVVDFLCIHHQTPGCLPESSLSKLTVKVQETREFLGPMIEAFRMEGSPRLFTPCNSDTPSPHCPFYPAWPPYDKNRSPSMETDCICGVPFSDIAAHTMAGLNSTLYPLTNVDSIHDVSDTNDSVDPFFPYGPKRFHHPHIFSDCSLKSTPCQMNSTTVSQPYYKKDKADTGFPHATAHEIRIKMKSRQVYTIHSSNPNITLDHTDSESICQKINRKSYKWALSRASPVALARFKVYGQPMVMKKDQEPVLPIGPLFINHGTRSFYVDLRFQDRKVNGKWILYVESIAFKTPNEGFVTTLYPDSNGIWVG
jgi:Alpha/beta hydrolase family